jgi:CxxC motif-containing protein (DUF1111 family)
MTMKGRSRFLISGLLVAILAWSMLPSASQVTQGTEAPAAFDNQTNGAISPAEFSEALAAFTQSENAASGLGPTFNGVSCVQCHASAGAIGGSSQILEFRAGHTENAVGFRWQSRFPYGRRDQNEFSLRPRFGQTFIPATAFLNDGSTIPDRSLINQRAICQEAQSHIGPGENVTAGRLSLSVLGDGFVEAIPEETLRSLAASQAGLTRGRIQGQVIEVPVLEAEGTTAVGRFGWKNQHASLLSFSADAYLNEMGITTLLLPEEVTQTCQPPGIPQPNDDNEDIESFAAFMRATKAPPRGAINDQVLTGAQIFRRIQCAVCHVETLTTAPAGTVLLGGTYTVPAAIGDKIIHPFSDFLLHNVGTGDGIVQNGGPETAYKLRTTPLWGLRTRNQFMHDAQSPSLEDSILRHRGEAWWSSQQYQRLSQTDRQALIAFLLSL